ncbi:unnamed protein product [Trichogramma brassicae]|uniref:Importin subunit beta-1/Transportin-1-like TPR repeats domain-containing protein n=1 Tax=Trichogramma brassicae TaxID=86971 RepID=A0A6H5ILM2_9HYME|nr:unnamed protein product [Trichogramma brassicae]
MENQTAYYTQVTVQTDEFAKILPTQPKYYHENAEKKHPDDAVLASDTKGGLANPRAILFLVLWYIFSGFTLFLNKYILTYMQGDPTVLESRNTDFNTGRSYDDSRSKNSRAPSQLPGIYRVIRAAAGDSRQPLAQCLFAVLSSPVDDFGGEYDDDESITPGQSAHAALDDIALNIPASTLLTVMLKYVQPALQSDNEFVLKACFISLATVTEGCSDYIRSKHLEDFLKLAITGINNNSNIVKSAAFYAIGQFSEYLQPEISKYVNEVLPILFQNLDIVLQRLQKEPQGSTAVARRVFYALEIFIENLGDDLLPYLPVLMKALSEIILETNSAPEIWACALSTVGSICTACEKNVLPYFAQIVEMLKKFLVKPDLTNEDQINVVCEAIDALGIFARTIGSENFAPLVEDSMQYALNVLAEGEDPDLRKSVYGLLGAMSCVLKDDMHVVIAKVLDRMMDSITSTESIITQFKDNGDDAHLVYEDLNDSEEEEKAEDEEDIANTDDETENDEEDEDVAGYTVENAFVAEKEAAISAVREIAMNAEKAFQPYTDSFFNAIFELLTFPQEDVKASAIEALTQLCMNYAKENTEEKAFPLFQSLARLVPKLAEIIRCDTERDVVIAALQSYTTLLDKLGAFMLHVEGHKEAFVNCALDVMRGQTECQDTTGQDPDEEEDPEEAEHDEYLFDHACQLLVAIDRLRTTRYQFDVHPILFAGSRSHRRQTSQQSRHHCRIHRHTGRSRGTLREHPGPAGHRIVQRRHQGRAQQRDLRSGRAGPARRTLDVRALPHAAQTDVRGDGRGEGGPGARQHHRRRGAHDARPRGGRPTDRGRLRRAVESAAAGHGLRGKSHRVPCRSSSLPNGKSGDQGESREAARRVDSGFTIVGNERRSLAHIHGSSVTYVAGIRVCCTGVVARGSICFPRERDAYTRRYTHRNNARYGFSRWRDMRRAPSLYISKPYTHILTTWQRQRSRPPENRLEDALHVRRGRRPVSPDATLHTRLLHSRVAPADGPGQGALRVHAQKVEDAESAKVFTSPLTNNRAIEYSARTNSIVDSPSRAGSRCNRTCTDTKNFYGDYSLPQNGSTSTGAAYYHDEIAAEDVVDRAAEVQANYEADHQPYNTCDEDRAPAGFKEHWQTKTSPPEQTTTTEEDKSLAKNLGQLSLDNGGNGDDKASNNGQDDKNSRFDEEEYRNPTNEDAQLPYGVHLDIKFYHSPLWTVRVNI